MESYNLSETSDLSNSFNSSLSSMSDYSDSSMIKGGGSKHGPWKVVSMVFITAFVLTAMSTIYLMVELKTERKKNKENTTE